MRSIIDFFELLFVHYRAHIITMFLSAISLFLYSDQENKAVQSLRVVGIQIVGVLENAGSSIASYISLREENNNLLDENKRLVAELQKYTLLANYAKRKPELEMFVKDRMFQSLVTARVINRSYANGYNYIMIDVGSRKGASEDMMVISEKGFVGRVIYTSPNYAIIQPVLNKDCRVAVVTDSTRVNGILEWEGDPTKAVIKYISFNTPVLKGENVYTSGYSSFAQEGMLVGKVIDVSQKQNSLFIDVTIELAVNFLKLDYVFVNTVKKDPYRIEVDSVYNIYQAEK